MRKELKFIMKENSAAGRQVHETHTFQPDQTYEDTQTVDQMNSNLLSPSKSKGMGFQMQHIDLASSMSDCEPIQTNINQEAYFKD